LSEAAQGELPKHEVFEKPFRVQPVYENWQTPDNYRRFPGGEKLPDKVKVWRIQKTSEQPGGGTRPYGVVSRSWGYNDSPDAEVLVPGYNTGKENGAVGVGRHGNFLQWGFSAPPSKMTDPGRSFFLNSISYIAKFDGKGPLIRMQSSHRFEPVRLAKAMTFIEQKSFFSGTFSPEMLEKYWTNPDGLMKYFQDDYELIYRDEVFLIDRELQSLGIESNRKVETLEKLIALLQDREKAKTAEKLLSRYALESFETPEEWRTWFAKNRDRIYFSDIGGYKFRVIPEGYLD
jgi:mRNA-degrading endonuclease HigB of HigAB toxin-antitoxin module